MDQRTDYDVILIGTGAGGGTLLHELAPTGKRILVLDRGDYLPREAANWSSRAVFVEHRYKAGERWRDALGRRIDPEIHYYVGGNTKLYGAALLRFRAEDFEEMLHVDGVSPAWPISYAEMEPFYTEAERLYHVHGERGIDPTEPPASGPFPWPPVPHEPRIERLHRDLEALGHRPFPLPMGVRLDSEHPHESPCIRCATCDGYPCLLHAKADAETCCVRPALRHPNVTLLRNACATRLLPGANGREVRGVEVEHEGGREAFFGDVVVVSCGAINSAALLLRSANSEWPHGAANRSGVVGRFYMRHNNSVFVTLGLEPNPTVFQKTLALNDFYLAHGDRPPLGHIQTMGKADAEKFEAASPVPLPRFVLERIGRHSLDFWITSEDLPRAENRVVLDPDGTIRLCYRPNNLAPHDRLVAELRAILRRIVARRRGVPFALCLRKRVPLSGTTHQCGTVRFGRDPRSSALDPHCKAHDLDNLYVVDGGFFPSSAALNPALTIMANALRVGRHLRERLGATAAREPIGAG